MIKGKSEFLTKIAKELNSKIDSVEFGDAGENALASVCGTVRGPEAYWITIKARHVPQCPHFSLWALYHEVCHTHQAQKGFRQATSTLEQKQGSEKEADEYAFRKMGMICNNGRLNPKTETCYWCIETRSKVCLKGFNL